MSRAIIFQDIEYEIKESERTQMYLLSSVALRLFLSLNDAVWLRCLFLNLPPVRPM